MNIRQRLASAAAVSAALALVISAADPAAALTQYGSASPNGSYWFAQNADDCVEASAEIVIRATGHGYYNQQTIENWAEAQGYYIPGSGTKFSAEVPILQHYGVPNVSQGAHSITTVEGYLGSGKQVIAAVDSEEIWNAVYGYQVAVDHGVEDHALVVDVIVPDQPGAPGGYVELDDTGNNGSSSGANEIVSLAVFKDAWSKSGYSVTVGG